MTVAASFTGRPVDSGSLTEHSLLRLLERVRRESLRGGIVIKDAAGETSVVYARNGLIVHIDRPNDQDRLDRVVVELGLVTASQLAAAEPVRAAGGKRLGEALLEQRSLDRVKLAGALRAQLERKAAAILARGGAGKFQIHSADHPYGVGADLDLVAVHPWRLMHRAAAAIFTEDRMRTELAGAATGKTWNVPHSDDDLRPFELPASTGALLEQLRGRWLRPEDAFGLAHDAVGHAALLALHTAGMLETIAGPAASEGKPVVAGAAAPAEAARPTPASPATSDAKARERAEKAFHAGEAALRAGDAAKAEVAFAEAAQASPTDLEYRALLAWVRLLTGGSEREGRVAALEKAVGELIAVRPNAARGHYLVGEVMRLRKEPLRAEKAFRSALEIEPAMIEAKRALAEVMAARTTGAHPSSASSATMPAARRAAAAAAAAAPTVEADDSTSDDENKIEVVQQFTLPMETRKRSRLPALIALAVVIIGGSVAFAFLTASHDNPPDGHVPPPHRLKVSAGQGHGV